MFEIGWAELMVIGVVALIVIGPEDLPDMFRQIGRFTGKLRQMGREFQRAMDQAAKDSGVKDAVKDIGALTTPKAMGLDAVRSAADKFEKWDPIKNAANPTIKAKAPTTGEAVADDVDAALAARTTAATASMTPATSSLTSVAELTAAEGPATKALRDKQAARAAVMAESAAKLKAIEDGTYVSEAAKPVRKTRVKVAAEPIAEKVKTPRKAAKKKDAEL